MLSLLLLVLFAAFTTRGDKCSIRNASLDGYKWDVTEWSAGCTRSCTYSFMISGLEFDENIKIPAFTARCEAYHEGGPFVPCTMLSPSDDPNFSVSSLLRRLNPGADITVSYKFPDPNQSETYRNITGSATTIFNQFVAPPQNFTITPTDFVGVS